MNNTSTVIMEKDCISAAFFYERRAQILDILLSKRIPEQSRLYLLTDKIVQIDGVAACEPQNCYKLVCEVNLFHFDINKVVAKIMHCLNDFFEQLEPGRACTAGLLREAANE